MSRPTKRPPLLQKKNSLTTWIFGGIILGLFVGIVTPQWVSLVKPFQTLFMHGVKCAIAPLIFSTIVLGIASAGSFKQLGLMGIRTFVYFEVVTVLALALGLLVVNIVQPGAGVNLSASGSNISIPPSANKVTLEGFLQHLIPINIVDAIGSGNVLQIVTFSTLFALSVLAVGEKARPVVVLCEALAETMFKFVSYIMYLAPLGVAAALASAVSLHGWEVILPLLKLVGTLYFALILFIVGVLFPIAKIFRVPIFAFIRNVKNPVLWAFATTSSESAYPMALEGLAQIGIPRRISGFVLPMGYSFNLDGSTLYLSLASVFIAQVAGIDLPISQQLLIMATLMLTSKGVAAVPRASIVVLSGTLSAFGLPLEGLALILGVDAFMDMGRSAINLLGNCLATAVIARAEGIKLGKPIVEEEIVLGESGPV